MSDAATTVRAWTRLSAMVIALVSPGALAAVQLGAVNANGSARSNRDIPVAFAGVETVTSLQFDVRFDANRITPGDAKLGDAAPGHRIDSRKVGAGVLRVVVYSTTLAPLGTGNVVQIPVKWNTAGDSGMRIENVQAVSPDGAKVDCVIKDTEAIGASGPMWVWGLFLVPVALFVLWWWRRRASPAANR